MYFPIDIQGREGISLLSPSTGFHTFVIIWARMRIQSMLKKITAASKAWVVWVI